jgi:MtN3 and saliva related transmembrane protein
MAVASPGAMTELLGWLSSLILLATVLQQIWAQWRERSTRDVSKWLFIGQSAASAGFTTYSWLVHNWVFVVTNGLLLISALAGCAMTWWFRTHPPAAGATN